MTKRGMPKPFAILIAALLALYFVPLGALPATAANGPSVDVYDQCQVGNPPVAGDTCETWTNGILNGTHNVYNEDDVTPQRLVMTFPTAGTQTVDLTYLTFDHGVHAYDSLATWNHTVENADRCANIGSPANCVGGSPNTFPIPLDGTTHHDVGVGKSAIVSSHQLTGQVLTMYGGTLTGATYVGMNVYAPDYQTLRVSFTTTSADQKVMLLFGGHIAPTFGPRGWGEKPDGTNLGAAQVPGGSYHIRVTQINNEAIGNRDNQLMSDAIAPPDVTGISTQATAGPVTIGGSITDTATVTPSNAVGTVTFRVYGPNDATCSGAVAFTSANRPVTSGTATSEAFTPTAVGTYRWVANFVPTDPTKFNPVTGACNDANESSVIVKKQPTISTDAEDEAQLLSNNPSITDVATVSNLTSDAGGTVTFKLYGPGDTTCTGTVLFTNEKSLGTVTAGVATVTSDAFTPTAAGTYRWVASYSGDAKNQPVSGACNDTNESSVVNPASPTITTDADDEAKLPGDNTISDTATLSGATANAGGTIVFKLFGPDPTPGTPTCDDGVGGNLVFTSAPVAVDGPDTYGPVSTTVDKAGTYFWIAYYSGDANNSAVAGVCGDPTETSDVDKASPEISTTATNAQLPGATSISDTAHLTGLTADATGTVTFNVWGPFALNSTPTCTGDPFDTVEVALPAVGGDHAVDVASGAVPVSSAGKYYWVASYGGDANNEAVTGACGDEGETSTVNPANPTIVTTATGGSLPVGSISDSANLTGVTAGAGGTITFKLYGPSANPDCSGSVLFQSSVSVSGPGNYGPVTTTVANAGSYYWVATYSGDANNNPAAGDCGDDGETSVVTKASPDISTEAVATDDTLPGTSVKDTATLTGLSANATGDVTFTVYSNASCTTLVTTLGPVAISTPVSGSASATSPDYTGITQAGTYWFIASYSGDANNDPVEGECGDDNEDVTIKKAQPKISTEATDATLPAGTIHDVATLTGLTAGATGTVDFALWDNADCSGDPVFTSDNRPISSVGGSVTATSANYTPTVAGDYYWIATYSGDANNEGVAGECGEPGETSTVSKAGPAITTDVPGPNTLNLGQSGTIVTDTATLTGATADASGTISFQLYGPFASDPGDTSCVDEKKVGGAVDATSPVSGNGTYTSGMKTVSAPGYYTWVATYSGDDNNASATHDCGQTEETVLINKAPTSISTEVTDASVALAPTATLVDVATLSGATIQPPAGGTIEFNLYGPFSNDPTGDDTVCTVDNFFASVGTTTPVSGPGAYTSEPVTVSEAGFYVWLASYSGDANNLASIHDCGDAKEVTHVTPAHGAISTDALDDVQLSSDDTFISDKATLVDVTVDPAAAGTIEFKVYGPYATAAAAQTAESCVPEKLVAGGPFTVDVDGPGDYVSPDVLVTKAGFYVWVASYSGDDNNLPATHECGQVEETTAVDKAQPEISTVATEQAVIDFGQSISDTATVTGLTDDGDGTVTFELFGPDNATCQGDAIFTSEVPLDVSLEGGVATGVATSASFTPTQKGVYRWIATYNGDDNNKVVAGECNDPNEQSLVLAGPEENLDKNSVPPSGSVVQPGSTVDYSVKVWNSGDVAITNADVVDILPPHVTVKPGTISDGGVLSADGTRITWKVTLAPADAQSTADEKTFTYSVTVNANAPQGAVLVNTARFFELVDTTTHIVPTGALTVLKAVSPVAGNGTVVEFGDTLTYTLTVTATGNLNQPNVKVTDYVPGYDPARPTSGKTTYVAGSAACVGAGTCTVTQPGADHLITWQLGDMAAGTSRQVTFKVTIDDIKGDPGETVSANIRNAGAAQSDRTPKTPSNEVVTPVTKVLPIKRVNPPKVLPHTGASIQPGALAAGAVLLLGLGLLLVAGGRRRAEVGSHRR